MSKVREHLRCNKRGCTYATNRLYNLIRHERNHRKDIATATPSQPCPHCTYTAESVHNLLRHINKKHNAPIVDRNQQPVTGQETNQPKQVIHLERSVLVVNPKQERKSESPRSSLWHWSTPQQQEKNFFRRSGLNNECQIGGRVVKVFKLYALVKVRGGVCNVDEWDDVADALGLPAECGPDVRAWYIDKLFEFETKEEERLQECSHYRVPSWWDDGDFITEDVSFTYEDSQLDQKSLPEDVNSILQLIFDKYYTNHLNEREPFQRFQVKDSWLAATMLTYRELKYQMQLQQPVP